MCYDSHTLVYGTDFYVIQRVLVVVAQSRVSLLTTLAIDTFAGILNLLCTLHIIYFLGFVFLLNLFIGFRKGEGRRERDLLFLLFMQSLVDSLMCPDRGSNPQPWRIGMTL